MYMAVCVCMLLHINLISHRLTTIWCISQPHSQNVFSSKNYSLVVIKFVQKAEKVLFEWENRINTSPRAGTRGVFNVAGISFLYN